MTIQEVGEILANETMSVSKMYMESRGVKVMEREFWLFLHIGFLAGLKLAGYPSEDAESALSVAQGILDKQS